MRKMFSKCLIAAVCVVLLAGTALAKPHLNGSQLNAAQCSPGPNTKLVLNIVFQVTGDADSGIGGYWAMDSYTKHVQVWDLGNSTFCVIVKYDGSFTSVAGVSPAGVSTIGAGVTGTIEGGYSGILSGATFTPAGKRTKGNIGTKDFGCSIDNTGTALGCTYYSWIADYFSGASFAYTYWSWTYNAGDNGTWINASTGNSGDITGN
jgi:hypothetical protein